MDTQRFPSPLMPPQATMAHSRSDYSVPCDQGGRPFADSTARRQKQPTVEDDDESISGSQHTQHSAPIVHQSTPIEDAVTTAFDRTPTTSQLDPNFIKQLTEQVTEQVIKNLKAANIGAAVTGDNDLPVQAQKAQRSSVSKEATGHPAMDSPPFQRQGRSRRRDSVAISPSRSPNDVRGKLGSQTSQGGRSRSSTGDYIDPPAWSYPGADSGLRRSQTTTSRPSRFQRDDSVVGDTPVAPGRKDSGGPEISRFDGNASDRSRKSSVVDESEEATTLEKIWQPLFENGKPTRRLSQFLRGLARHLAEDYEPKDSLVISPVKMLHFFEETKVADEQYPWSTIFGGKMTNASLSNMYRKLLCQHHLIQNKCYEAPNTPALTSAGFESFMTCLILAHPDIEFARLKSAVTNMPISNADDKSERFPKDLSRRLLPKIASVPAEQRIISSLDHEPGVVPTARRATKMPPPPSSVPPRKSSVPDSDPAAFSRSPEQINAFDDRDLTPPLVQIERERKPYYGGKEGTGKKYDQNDRERGRDGETSRAAPGNPRTDASNLPPSGPPRPMRHNSGKDRQPPYSGGTNPVNFPPVNTRHRGSTGHAGPPPSSSSGGRRRSPPPSRNYARSEPIDPVTAGMPLRDRFPPDIDDEPPRQYGSRRHSEYRNIAKPDDEPPSRGYPIPRRSNTGSYDNNHGQAAPPPNIGNNSNTINYGPFNSSSSSYQDRRSWYGLPNNNNGVPPPPPPDAYGSSVPTNGRREV